MLPAMTCSRRILATAATVAAIAASALVAAPAASAAPGDNRAVVNAWYEDFLRRDAEVDPGSQYWVNSLDSGDNPGDVLWRITHSEEFNAYRVDLNYRMLLQRSPDPGARYWVDGVNAQRFPLEWARQNILASQEYLSGKNSSSVVNSWYGWLLGRSASAGEVSYWSGRINAVGPLGAVREIYYTNEAVTRSIAISHSYLLDRSPKAEEVSYWYPKEVENSVNVEVLIAAGSEYRSQTR